MPSDHAYQPIPQMQAQPMNPGIQVDQQTWTESLNKLDREVTLYTDLVGEQPPSFEHSDTKPTSPQGHVVSHPIDRETQALNVVAAMRVIGDSHPDPAVTRRWHERANDFAHAGEGRRCGMLQDIGKGLLILVATPVAVAGVAVASAGGIIYGTGLFLRGLGSLMMCGLMS